MNLTSSTCVRAESCSQVSKRWKSLEHTVCNSCIQFFLPRRPLKGPELKFSENTHALFILSHTLQIEHTLGPEGDIFPHCPFIWCDINLWPSTLLTVVGCNQHHFQFKYLFSYSWCSFQSCLHLFPLNSFFSCFSSLPSFISSVGTPAMCCITVWWLLTKSDFIAIISVCVPLISTQTACWPVAQCHNQCQSL